MLPEGTIYRSLTKLIWISLVSRRYPSIVVHAQEERGRQLEDGSAHPVDTSLPNPNSIEFDNLYLDMNGIIHPCCHPEDRPAPRNEEEMMLLIFEYIDRLFNICRPRRLLYMAIDGVAPRAKMNQQRSRRFRSSKEAGDKEMEMEKAKQRLLDQGLQIPEKALADDEVVAEKFDSNCITPGTEFMANLARNLRYYVHNRLNNDPGWAGISVILSDANVPGEGEHKIMDFIRKQRSNPDHDPNTQHCLCGADADLIMLGLATHEVNFSIIREEFKPNAPRPCELCGQVGHDFKQCTGKSRSAEDEQEPATPAQAVEFIFLRLSVLREYLEKELKPDVPWTFGFDLERAIDDWVFMCFFVGNDFLPHLPSLEIREGAIDRLIDLYKRNAERNGGYLTENGFVDMQRCQVILYELGKMEDSILKNRMEKSKFERRRDRQRAQQNKRRMEEEEERSGKRRRTNSDAPAYGLDGAFAAMPVSRSVPSTPIVNARETVHNARVSANHYSTNSQNLSSAQQLRKFLVTGEESAPPVQRASSASSLDRTANGSRDNLQDEDEDPNDVVRLGEDGWKQRYYLNKFAVEIDRDSKFQSEIVFSYVEGLCWVLQYYYQGCPSWTWYYPYHYSPFASDFINIIRLKIEFPLGTKPFKPLEQLMGVFPEASGVFLPTEWRKLMGDPDSEILDFYPTDFSVDLNGKKFAWQGVALLPFVDENRLLRVSAKLIKTSLRGFGKHGVELETDDEKGVNQRSQAFMALARVYDTLTAEEQARNCLGESVLFVGQPHKIFPVFQTTFFTSSSAQATSFQPMSSSHIFGMAGLVSHDADAYPVLEEVEGPFASMPTIAKNKALSVLYRDPGYEEGHKYQAIRLAGAKDPVKVLTEGRVQLGYDPNRRQMRLSEGAQRMVGGAVRGMDRHSYGGNGYEGGRGRGGGGGRGGYENRNGWNAQRDERRGYNEEREPRWEDNPNRFRDRDSQQYSRRDQYNQGSGSSYGGYSGGNEEFNRYDNRRSDYNNRDTHYSNQSANGRYPSGRDSYSNQPHSYPDYQQGYNQSQSGYSPYQSRSALQMPPPRQPQYPPSSDSSQTRYYTSNYRRSN